MAVQGEPKDTLQDIEDFVDNAATDVLGVTKKDKVVYEPIYKVVGEAKIPVSKAAGKVWKSRKDAGLAKRKYLKQDVLWDQCIRYYKNDQSVRREDDTKIGSDRANEETENIVFANASALVPATYAKNPDVEITVNDEADDEFGTICERLVNALFSKRAAPGINLKSKARKAVVMTTLTNLSWLEIGYTKKEHSSDEALTQINELALELEKAKTPKKLRETEAKLEQVEKKVDILRPSGPWVRFRSPHDVIEDADATDFDENRYMFIMDMVSTDMIKVVYGEQQEDGSWNNIYQSTHVLKLDDEQGPDGIENAINTFSLIDGQKNSAEDYGYDNEVAYQTAQRTKVWYVWDKITRRVLMFNDGDWTWPIWVWEDPYQLDCFFPLYPLEYYTDPVEMHGMSEVAYYLDQQDAINEVNKERRKWRRAAINRHIYNTRALSQKEVEDFVKSEEDDVVVGVKLPDGMKIEDVIQPLLPASIQLEPLFDNKKSFESIDRLSSVTPIMKGVEFKTNTTNKAIEQYDSASQTRLDEKIDAVEDLIGRVGWGVLQMALQFMDDVAVGELLNEAAAKLWKAETPMTPRDIRSKFTFRIVGGSALKPTARTKKEEAIQISQILGVFANASPAAVIISLKVLERAFDEVTIKKEDWKFISESIEQQMQRGNTSPDGQGAPAQGAEGQAQGGEQDVIGVVEQIISKLPPEALDQLGEAISNGTTLKEAIQAVIPLAS